MAVSVVIDADTYRRDNGMAVSGVIDADHHRRDTGTAVSGGDRRKPRPCQDEQAAGRLGYCLAAEG